jgi:hypothetical protein
VLRFIGTLTLVMSIQNFDEMERDLTITEDLDPDDDMPGDADPMAEYLTYLADVRGGAVGDMGFTLEDFKRYIAGLRKRPRGKIADDS